MTVSIQVSVSLLQRKILQIQQKDSLVWVKALHAAVLTVLWFAAELTAAVRLAIVNGIFHDIYDALNI